MSKSKNKGLSEAEVMKRMMEGVDYIYLQILDTKKKTETGEYVWYNPTKENAKVSGKALLVIELPDFLFNKETLNAILKEPAIKVTKELKEAYILSEQNIDFILEYYKQPKRGKFRRSAHLIDQMLKYDYPKDKSTQLSIFDNLLESTKKDIEVVDIKRDALVEGIKLSPSQTKIVDCLCMLLHETSQTKDPQKEDYYTGNMAYELMEYIGSEKTPAPRLAFTLYEITKEYKGGESVSGKDVENVKQVLYELDNKLFLIRYTETTIGSKGEYIKKEYEGFRKLINLDKASISEGVGNVEEYKNSQVVVLLHPIFRRQINSKFINTPTDILRRTIIAYGSHNVSDIALRLREDLMRAHSGKHYTYEIGQERLYYLLSEKWMKEGRRKKVKEYTEKAIETAKALGLLLSHEIKPDAKGGYKVVFTLNKNWE